MTNPRLHLYLWLLTGRCDDFVAPALNTGLRYGAASRDPETEQARKMLHLTDTSTDYYVIGAMAALYAARSALRGMRDEETVMFLPGSLRLRAPSVSGGEFRLAGPRYPTMLHRPRSLPAARTWYVTYLNSLEVTITNDAGYSSRADYAHVNDTVYVKWPAETGFHAAFAPTGNVWTTGSRIVIRAEPSGYPYAAVAESIRQSNSLIRVMSAEGTLTAFVSAVDPLQQVGALVAAIVLRNHKLSPPLQ